MRILLVTDAWKPQVNGVVRTLSTVVDTMERRGHTVATVSPDQFRTLPCPSNSNNPSTMLSSMARWRDTVCSSADRERRDSRPTSS